MAFFFFEREENLMSFWFAMEAIQMAFFFEWEAIQISFFFEGVGTQIAFFSEVVGIRMTSQELGILMAFSFVLEKTFVWHAWLSRESPLVWSRVAWVEAMARD